jgi:hypothetical protein
VASGPFSSASQRAGEQPELVETVEGAIHAADRYKLPQGPPGLSPITTVGRYATVEEAQVATDEVWAAR